MKRVLTILLFFAFAASMLPQSSVTFNVNMSVQVKKKSFNLTTGTVNLAGTINNWNATATPMTKSPTNDSIFTVTVDNLQDTIEFKFIKDGGWEGIDNRKYIIVPGTNVVNAYFNNDSIFNASETKDIQLSFTCNMELEIASGRFVTSEDTLRVKGTLNGWSDKSIMTRGIGSYYTFDTTLVLALGDSVEYKFNYKKAGAGETWEGGDNKKIYITQAVFDEGFAMVDRGFNDLSLDDVVNQESSILFAVDVTNAKDAHTNLAFTSVDNVILAGAVTPLQWPVGGWPSATAADSARVIFLNDSGIDGDKTAGDKIWSKLIEFPKYTGFTVQYKYGINFGKVTNNDNENSTQNDHFFEMSKNLTYGETQDVFGDMGTKELVNVQTIGIKEVEGETPKTFALNQNYPNPFNPSTIIRYSIPQSAFVTLKVYNLLGEEVETLVNTHQNASNYEVSFDASKLSSGIYFYTIHAGSYMSTKKMILMK